MIEVTALSKTFGRTKAVDHLSFTVRPGVVTGFLGPNGAGKSTTMRMILGLDNPTSGQALIDGRQYASLVRPLTKVGALLDANWVHPNRSARAHLRWMAASNGLPTHRVDEVLDTVGLTSVAGKAVGKFSLGMKQRLGLAGAILGDPEVLLFDEPVNGLDPEGIVWIRQFMQSLASAGRTVFVSSHLLSEMAVTADHLIVIGRGRLIADASTADFIKESTESTVKVRSPRLAELADLLVRNNIRITPTDGALTVHSAPIEQVGDLAGAAGITLHELSGVQGSLEEAFMQLTGDSVEYGGHGLPAGGDPMLPSGTVAPGGGTGGYGPQSGYGPPDRYGPPGGPGTTGTTGPEGQPR
ncbi:ABC-2 type transport system ATP-binding protein [Nakamurella panacisegetis]|uniref:ABC-2 type transport system ATP-binding protein n=1 Tax=Nakamurella panacisegetis TaxID=1090615 RepID=A0A1H0MB64_9ACTN|nr:ABC transporter ATP-binding protein [Nakamurella panacisegetis]SDO77466.1 ABC-2 type transport system ATP-binding protein [Nakamurella panacisegetis]